MQLGRCRYWDHPKGISHLRHVEFLLIYSKTNGYNKSTVLYRHEGVIPKYLYVYGVFSFPSMNISWPHYLWNREPPLPSTYVYKHTLLHIRSRLCHVIHIQYKEHNIPKLIHTHILLHNYPVSSISLFSNIQAILYIYLILHTADRIS
jgi:hypothetical protein